MRKLDLSFITPTVGMPEKSGTLAHLQLAYQHAISHAVQAQIGNGYVTTQPYILYGCVNSGTAPAYNVSAGSVYYNGEVFQVDAVSGSLSNPNVLIGNIATSFFSDPTADPVQFTDGTNHNVHQVRKFALTPGLSGGGESGTTVSDFVNWKKANTGQMVNEIKMYYPAGALSADFNLTSGIGISSNCLGYALCDGNGGRPNMMGKMPVAYNPSDTDYNLPGKTGGNKTVTLLSANMPAAGLAYKDTVLITADNNVSVAAFFPNIVTGPTGTNGNNYGQSSIDAANINNNKAIQVSRTTGGGSSTAVDTRDPYFTVVMIIRIY